VIWATDQNPIGVHKNPTEDDSQSCPTHPASLVEKAVTKMVKRDHHDVDEDTLRSQANMPSIAGQGFSSRGTLLERFYKWIWMRLVELSRVSSCVRNWFLVTVVVTGVVVLGLMLSDKPIVATLEEWWRIVLGWFVRQEKPENDGRM
jgi:hypothetical protein